MIIEYYEEGKVPKNTVQVPLEAFLAQLKVLRDIRALHYQTPSIAISTIMVCHECSTPWGDLGCSTIQAFTALDNLEDPDQ